MKIKIATLITGLLSLILFFFSIYLRWGAFFRILFKLKALPASLGPLISLIEPGPYLAVTYMVNCRNIVLAIVFANLIVYAGTAILATALAYTLNRSMWMWGGLSALFPQFFPILLTFLKPNSVPPYETKRCVHCGNIKAGKNYSFRYGEHISSEIHTDQLPTVGVSTKYRIVGKREGWICHSCVVQQGVWAIFLGTVLGFLTVGLFHIGGIKSVNVIIIMDIASSMAIFWGVVQMKKGGEELVIKTNLADVARYKILR